MTTHLPECFLSSATCPNSDLAHPPTGGACTHCGGVCICDLLRACEARVRAFYDAEIERQGAQWEASCRQFYRSGSNDGKELALDAARDAVAALDEHDSCVGFNGPAIYRQDALDAIDALRGDPVT